jgi:transposase
VITIGIDPHKGTHTAAAVDGATGQFLDESTVPATDEGAEHLHTWARALADDGELRFALEDVRNVSGRLERFLLSRSELVLRVGTRLTAGTRKSARTYGKSDSIDALAVARTACASRTCPGQPMSPSCAS